MLTFFIMHMFSWVWYIHQNVNTYVHMLRHQNIVTYINKKNICVYTWKCLSMHTFNILAYVYVKT